VAYLSGHQQWNAAFNIGVGAALLAALAWVAIRVAEPAAQAVQLEGLV
jgi:hypothetical protein